MKTLITILLLSILLISCKKPKQTVKYTCTCKVTDNFGRLYTTEPTYYDISRDEADAKCKEEKTNQENLVVYEGYKRNADCNLH